MKDASPLRPRLQSAPFLRDVTDTPRIMRELCLALLPVIASAVFFFGWSAILVLSSAAAGALLAELGLGRFTGTPGSRSLRDGSALLTGLLLGCTLPPATPLWMALLGGLVAITLGKTIWGGLGQNLFNPALVGRAFLQAAFPTTLTSWSPQAPGAMSLQPGNLALPFMQAAPDALTAATPLGLLKFQQQATELLQLLLGNTGGSLGETSAGIILLCGLFLAARRLFDWRIPVGILGTALLFAGIVYLLAPESQPLPVFHVLSGGLAFGAVFMATDPVTSPMAPLATWIYAIGIGALVVLIRLWGGLPEGVMYAILLWNAATPLLNRVIQPTPLGRGREARTGGAETQR